MLAVAVALAAGLGAVLRYVVDQIVQYRTGGDFPYGTLAINLSGSLLLGVITGLALAPRTTYRPHVDHWHRVGRRVHDAFHLGVGIADARRDGRSAGSRDEHRGQLRRGPRDRRGRPRLDPALTVTLSSGGA